MDSRTLIAAGVREAVKEALFFADPFLEQCELRYREAFDTACWMFRPPHVIVIGLEILAPRRMRAGLSEEDLRRYAGNFYHHEMAHARYTGRTGAIWAVELEEADVPFRLYNLFEDARIERKYTRETGRPFNWTRYEKVGSTDSPLGYFFAIVQNEGRQVKSELPSEVGERVRAFYEEAVRAESSEALLPVLLKWLATFPASKCATTRFDGELDIAYADEDAQNAFLTSCLDTATIDAQPLTGTGSFGAGTQMQLLGAGGIAANGWPDVRRSQALANILQRAFLMQHRRTLVERPVKRLSVKHFIRGDARFYRESRRRTGNPEHLGLILDCSGSMNGDPLAQARVLLSALSQLVRKGLVRCTVLLSANLKGALCWQRVELPLDDREIATIHACGSGEALQGTILANLRLIEQLDRVYVFTDGDLRDEPVDKARLHKLGVYTTGLYVGSAAKQSSLEKYFDRSFVRDSIEDIGMALLQ